MDSDQLCLSGYNHLIDGPSDGRRIQAPCSGPKEELPISSHLSVLLYLPLFRISSIIETFCEYQVFQEPSHFSPSFGSGRPPSRGQGHGLPNVSFHMLVKCRLRRQWPGLFGIAHRV